MSSGYSNSKTISFLNPVNNSKNNDVDDSISNNLNIIDESYSNIHSGKNTEYTVYCYITNCFINLMIFYDYEIFQTIQF